MVKGGRLGGFGGGWLEALRRCLSTQGASRSPWVSQAARSRQARPAEARRPTSGTAQAGTLTLLRRRPIDGEVEHAARAHDVEQRVDVREDGLKALLLGGGRLAVLRVEARVDDPVHIDVEVVDRARTRLRTHDT